MREFLFFPKECDSKKLKNFSCFRTIFYFKSISHFKTIFALILFLIAPSSKGAFANCPDLGGEYSCMNGKARYIIHEERIYSPGLNIMFLRYQLQLYSIIENQDSILDLQLESNETYYTDGYERFPYSLNYKKPPIVRSYCENGTFIVVRITQPQENKNEIFGLSLTKGNLKIQRFQLENSKLNEKESIICPKIFSRGQTEIEMTELKTHH